MVPCFYQKIVHIVNIVFATRDPKAAGLNKIASYIQYGVSPRATLALLHASKAHAFLKRQHFVTPDDVKAVAPAILRHRISLSYEAEADEVKQDSIVYTLLSSIPTP